MSAPAGALFFGLAAIAAAVVVAAAAGVAAAAAAEQQNQNDDPPAGVATEAVVVAHNEYLQEIFRAVCRSFQDIPQPKKGAGETNRYMQRLGPFFEGAVSRAG